ncbi:ZIP family metal transporter [Methanogenium cariaci]|uniref:ZIP family metal transporter n=1 Tax=Methanogenium cariaci TaxID=2197 RepID=UPI0024810E6D|nr:ZIP family metal transporter [Methanogenium cariaci]
MMWDYFLTLTPVTQALLAGIFTWGMTAFGAATVFLTREVNQKFLDVMLGFAAGVMIAASFWSLLLPAIELSAGRIIPAWFPAAVGFILGGIALGSIDRVLPHLHIGYSRKEAEGIPTSWPRSTLLLIAITMHNIPEGLAVGVAFGALAVGSTEAMAAAVALAIGIGIQNFPEDGHLDATAPGGVFGPPEFLVRAALRSGRTGGSRHRSSGGHHCHTHPALCPCLCRRSDDLCGHRRSDS